MLIKKIAPGLGAILYIYSNFEFTALFFLQFFRLLWKHL